MYRLESAEYSMVADIGLEVVVAADTVPEVGVVGVAGIVPVVVEDSVPVVVGAADTVLELAVAADIVLAVSQQLGSDMALAVYRPTTDQFCSPEWMPPSHRILAGSSIPQAFFQIENETYLWVLWLLKRRYRSRCWRVRWRWRKRWKIRHCGKRAKNKN